jgi:hypothetical protein
VGLGDCSEEEVGFTKEEVGPVVKVCRGLSVTKATEKELRGEVVKVGDSVKNDGEGILEIVEEEERVP